MVLVDDVPEIRQILRLILEHAGPFEVVGEGCNGHDAIRLAGELRPDLLVMDVEMRGGPSGWQVLPDIRATSPATAVVILSGSAADPMRSEREVMADGVLEKGLPPQELNDALLAILVNAANAARPAVAPVRATPRARPEGATDPAELLAAVLDLSGGGIVEVSSDGVVVSWNRGAERLFGRLSGDAVGTSFASLVGGDAGPLVQRATAGERIAVAPLQVAAPNGEPRIITLSLAPLAAGGAVVVAEDTSSTGPGHEAMAWAVTELDAKRREVERVRRELDGFASVASHDLAQPLQVAYGYLEMVRSEFAEGMDETAASWIDAAVGSLERMRVLVQDILAYARGGNRETEPQPVSVEEAVRSALTELEAFVQERRAEIRLRPPLPTVAANGERLGNVLEKLLDNAIRFVPADRVPLVEVFAEEGPDEWVITVADNGAGISAELHERVFDVFYRGAKSTNSGTGLGLSLSRKLVDRMGGRIWVEPRPGEAEGTWIRFALPKDLT